MNSNEQDSPLIVQKNTNEQSPDVTSSSEGTSTTSSTLPVPQDSSSLQSPLPPPPAVEQPLDVLPGDVSPESQWKPLIEMTDAELSAWHALHRSLQNPQTLAAHLRSGGKKVEKAPDISEYM